MAKVRIIEHIDSVIKEQMNDLADQILKEIRAEINSLAEKPSVNHTADSFEIMPQDNGNIIIGSTQDSAYFFDQGNEPTSRFVVFKPKHWDYSKRPHRPPDGYVRSRGRAGYEGRHYIKRVADRHR